MWIGGWVVEYMDWIKMWVWIWIFWEFWKSVLYTSLTSLLDESAVILDLTETSLERIIHTILNKMLDNLNAPLAYEEAMSTLFLPESGNILAKTIQVIWADLSRFVSWIVLENKPGEKVLDNPWELANPIIIARAQSGSTGQSWRTATLGWFFSKRRTISQYWSFSNQWDPRERASYLFSLPGHNRVRRDNPGERPVLADHHGHPHQHTSQVFSSTFPFVLFNSSEQSELSVWSNLRTWAQVSFLIGVVFTSLFKL